MDIEEELEERLAYFREQKMYLEAQRLSSAPATNFEMLKEILHERHRELQPAHGPAAARRAAVDALDYFRAIT